MNKADRKVAKASIRAALRAKALSWRFPCGPLGRVKRVLAWAIGTSLTIIAYHERIGERTIKNRIDQSLDAMRREFSGRNLPG